MKLQTSVPYQLCVSLYGLLCLGDERSLRLSMLPQQRHVSGGRGRRKGCDGGGRRGAGSLSPRPSLPLDWGQVGPDAEGERQRVWRDPAEATMADRAPTPGGSVPAAS